MATFTPLDTTLVTNPHDINDSMRETRVRVNALDDSTDGRLDTLESRQDEVLGFSSDRTLYVTAGQNITAGSWVGLSNQNQLYPLGATPLQTTAVVSQEVGDDVTDTVGAVSLNTGVLTAYEVGASNILQFYNVVDGVVGNRGTPRTGVTVSGEMLKMARVGSTDAAAAVYVNDSDVQMEIITAEHLGNNAYQLTESNAVTSRTSVTSRGTAIGGGNIAYTDGTTLYGRPYTVSGETITLGTERSATSVTNLGGIVDWFEDSDVLVYNNTAETSFYFRPLTASAWGSESSAITGRAVAISGGYILYQNGNDIRVGVLNAAGTGIAYSASVVNVANSVAGGIFFDNLSTPASPVVRVTYSNASAPQVLRERTLTDTGTALNTTSASVSDVYDFATNATLSFPNQHAIAYDPSSEYVIVTGRYNTDSYILGYVSQTSLYFVGYSKDGGNDGANVGYLPRGSVITGLTGLEQGTTYYSNNSASTLNSSSLGTLIGEAINATTLVISTSGSVTSSVSLTGQIEEYTHTVPNNATTFSFSGITSAPDEADLYLGGMKLVETTDYSFGSDGTVTLTSATTQANLVAELVVFRNFSISNALDTTEGGTISGNLNVNGEFGVTTNVSNSATVNLTSAYTTIFHTGSGTVTVNVTASTPDGAAFFVATEGTLTMAYTGGTARGISLGSSAKMASGAVKQVSGTDVIYFSEGVY